MKKWHIIAGISALLVIVLVVAGSLVYKYYLVPKYLEPVVEEFSETMKSDDMLAEIYSVVSDFHDEGVISDDTYSTFMSAYNKRTRDDEEFAREILAEEDENNTSSSDSNSLSARYASNKVGVELIQTEDESGKGKAASRYSTDRNSERTKSEDLLDARKIVDSTDEPAETEVPQDIQSAYDKLREHMTSSEYSTFLKIMRKLDYNDLKTYYTSADLAGLKEYLHSRLSDDEYSETAELYSKYIVLFMED